MEIHRPKPVHSFRELAVEVGVISIGIAIALSGEQMLEWLHRRAEVNEARHALNEEISANAMAARFNSQYVRCAQARFDRVLAWAEGGPHPSEEKLTGWVLYRTGAWEGIKGGAAAHMPVKARLAYAQIYDVVGTSRTNFERWNDVSLAIAGEARSGLARPGDPVGLRTDVARSRIMGNVVASNALDIIQAAKTVGVEPPPLPPGLRESIAGFCREAGKTTTSAP